MEKPEHEPDTSVMDAGAAELAALRGRVVELEAQLQAAAANDRALRTILDALPDSLYVKDCNLRKLLANHRDLLLMGMTAESDALGKTDLEVYTTEEAAHFYAQDSLVLSGEALINHEERITVHGEPRWLLTTKIPLRDEAGEIVGLVGIGRDITELKQAQASSAALLAANQALAETARLKDEFLANVSHELRTPLTGILAMAEALQGKAFGAVDERQQRLLQRIETSGRHLLRLINDMLDLSHLDAGKMELVMVETTLDAVGRSCVQAVAAAAAARRQTVHFCIEPETLTMDADPRRLRQVLTNLLDNAVKFTPEGGALGLYVTGSADANTIRLEVWDTGDGIADADQARLFQPFTQLDASLARRHPGAGLGLVLVKRIAELHGGQASVESTPGKGSRFIVTLPQRPILSSELNEGEMDGNGEQSTHH
jgi:PAS domain S-box-containing protein